MNLSALAIISLLAITSCSIRQPVASQEMPVQVKGNILFLDLMVNDKKAKFIVDTGASVSIVDYSQAREYGFDYLRNRQAGRLSGFGGDSDLRIITNLKITPSSHHWRNIPFYGSNLDNLNDHLAQHYTRVLGVLGSDFLSRNRAVIDYQQKRLILR